MQLIPGVSGVTGAKEDFPVPPVLPHDEAAAPPFSAALSASAGRPRKPWER